MRTTIILLILAVAAQAADRPNVVFFLIDDLGWRDVGCYGSTFHETPNVDRLAAEGMRFTNAYAASPVCSPTRASILTGKYPTRVHFTRATPTENLALAEVTLAEALKEAGLPQRPAQHVDGVDLVPLLTGKATKLDRTARYFHFPHDHGVNSMGASGAFRVGDYKLVERFADMSVELFNLTDDLGEHRDLSRQQPEVADQLRKMLHEWRRSTGAWIPDKKKESHR